jgi:DNA-binding response OmpR family regulator
MPRVLIIEDEEKRAGTLARVLREEGHVAETANNGRNGLSRALEDSFDLLIVDWMLPERSGVQIVLKRFDSALPPEISVEVASKIAPYLFGSEKR